MNVSTMVHRCSIVNQMFWKISELISRLFTPGILMIITNVCYLGILEVVPRSGVMEWGTE